MALDPLKDRLRAGLISFFNQFPDRDDQVFIQDWLARCSFPAILFPVFVPDFGAVYRVVAIGYDLNGVRYRDYLEGALHCGQFGALIGL
jgi:hypothetical protein